MPVLSEKEIFSLLFPQNMEQGDDNTIQLDENIIKDLELNKIINSMTGFLDEYHINKMHIEKIKKIFFTLVTDQNIIQYRQDFITELLDNPELFKCFEEILPDLFNLYDYYCFPKGKTSNLHELTYRIGELYNYTVCINKLADFSSKMKDKTKSEGLKKLFEIISLTTEGEIFKNLVEELPSVIEKIRGIASITLGINLDLQLRPAEVTILSINDKKFTGSTNNFINKIFGKEKSFNGITPIITSYKNESSLIELPQHDPLLIPIFRDLDIILNSTYTPIIQMLKKYTEVNTGIISKLCIEILFYLCIGKLLKRIKNSGLPICQPVIEDKNERITMIKDSYNINLAIELIYLKNIEKIDDEIITNDVTLDDEGRIIILTGPNNGGKTTFLQTIGLNQILFQIGSLIPGSAANISPINRIFSHFPIEEKIERGVGRLGEEAIRFRQIFLNLSPYSLILLNESLTSTAASESLYIAEDIVKALKYANVRAVYATHLHELAERVDKINNEVKSNSLVVSMVAQVNENKEVIDKKNITKRTFKIVKSKPVGHSYAIEIAKKYGIDYTELIKIIQERGIV